MTAGYAHGPLKRCIDVLGSASLLLATAPISLTAAGLIWLRMGRPILFRQQRPGLGGKPFELIKFRSMRAADSDAEGVGSDAARLTPLGRWLRASSVDELPALLNVLVGEMSLVGPRPLLMKYLPLYSEWQARRHDVKPGLTGWAQVHGRNAVTWNERFERDVWYVEHASPGLDLKILLMTVAKVLGRDGVNHPDAATMLEFTGNASSNGAAANGALANGAAARASAS